MRAGYKASRVGTIHTVPGDSGNRTLCGTEIECFAIGTFEYYEEEGEQGIACKKCMKMFSRGRKNVPRS